MARLLEGLTFVFPCHNEALNVLPVIRSALEIAPCVAERFEIVVVDDGSTDGTSECIRAAYASDSRVSIVRHEVNRGYGAALRSGFRAAQMPWIFVSDGDGQFDLTELPAFAANVGQADFVVGYRLQRADPIHRVINQRIFGVAVRLLLGLVMRDVDCAFKLFPRRLLQKIDLKSEGALISAELMTKARRGGYRFVEIGVQHHPRRRGSPTGARPAVVARAVKELWQVWWDLALNRYR